MLTIRPVDEADLPSIAAILNHEIEHGYAHFGTEPLALSELAKEFERTSVYPWFAAIEDGILHGFARSGPWKPRGGYRQTCEVSVYIRPESQGRGLARMLYQELLPELRRRRFHTLLAGIALPNPASVKLHESLGFTTIGIQPQVGWKQGAWRDVGYWALVFADVAPMEST